MSLILVVLAAWPAFALGPAEWDLELDAYYSALGVTVPFTKDAAELDVEQGEAATYRAMLERALVPRFLVLEASVNPMPLAGAAVREWAPGFYADAQLSPELNLVEAVTAGFEEPYALSLFLGKVIDFSKGEKRLGRSRKGYVGYLATGGNYHIVNNLIVRDDWLELEAKIKGDLATDARKMSWSLRGGVKLHDHPDIQNTIYAGIRRNRIDFTPVRWSFLLSSAVEYRLDLSMRDLKPIGHFLLIEKNIPLRKKWTFSLGLGWVYRGEDKYSGSLDRRRRPNESQILLRPNLKF